MTDIGCPHDGWVVVGEYKINVVWGPTHHENDHHKGKHFDNFLLVIPALGQCFLEYKLEMSMFIALWTILETSAMLVPTCRHAKGVVPSECSTPPYRLLASHKSGRRTQYYTCSTEKNIR